MSYYCYKCACCEETIELKKETYEPHLTKCPFCEHETLIPFPKETEQTMSNDYKESFLLTREQNDKK